MVFWLLFSNESIQNILILSTTVAPLASAGIRPVVNRLNQDTTVYYGLVFCLFSWPYMVKWHNSGIIKYSIVYLHCALGRVYMRKLAPAWVSHRDDFFISHRVCMMTGSFHILLFKGKFHVDKIHVWFKIANIMHALPVPVYRQTDFPPKRVVVSRLHDTVARFCTGVKLAPRYENRGELTPGWLVLA